MISIDSLLASKNKYYLQVYLENFDYKILNTEAKDHLDDNLFKFNLYYNRNEQSKGIDVTNSNNSK